jgi:dolichyl-phosphate beta-glucosyltransferase
VLEELPAIQWVFGARVNLLGRRIHRRPVRQYLGRVFATVVSTLLRLPVYDTQCGAKLFRATADLNEVLETPFGSRWVFDVEMIARLLHLHGRNVDRVRATIYEFPLHAWEDIAGSKVRSGDFVKAIREVLAIYRRYLR